MPKKTDIVIVSYNTQELTSECIESIYNTAHNLINSIIVVDNCSSDSTVGIIKLKFANVNIITNPENYGYAKAVNIGVNASFSEYVIISNSDVIFQENSIAGLINYLEENPGIGAAGPQQLYPDGTYQYSYGDLPGIKLGTKKLFLINHVQDYFHKKIWEKSRSKAKEVPYIDGAVIATRRDEFNKISGFDEDYYFYTEEADYCFRLKKIGRKIMYFPSSVITHFRGASDKSEGLNAQRLSQMVASKRKFCEKRLSYQAGKYYMVCEIIYSLNMMIIWYLKELLCHSKKTKITPDEKKAGTDDDKFKTQKNKFNSTIDKVHYNKILFKIWLDEFNKFLRSDGKSI